MDILIQKDIFHNIKNFLNHGDIINLLKTNKTLYLFLFNYEFDKLINIVFSYKIITKIQKNDYLENNYFVNKIISLRDISFFIADSILPQINHIYINGTFNILTISKLTNIETLIFSDNWNKPIGVKECHLPNNLKTVIFGKRFNQPIGYLRNSFIPNSVETIIFGKNFNQNLGNYCSYLPSNLKKLIFGDHFNKKIYYQTISKHSYNEPELSIPNGVEILTFGRKFNQIIHKHKNLIPKTVKYLTFGLCFNQPIMPSSFIIGNIMYYIPESVIELRISEGYDLSQIPISVTNIIFIDNNADNENIN